MTAGTPEVAADTLPALLTMRKLPARSVTSMLPWGKKAKLHGLDSAVLSSVTLSGKSVLAGDALPVVVIVVVVCVLGVVLEPTGVVVVEAVIVVVALGLADRPGVSPSTALLWLAAAGASAPPPQATMPAATKAAKVKKQVLPSSQL